MYYLASSSDAPERIFSLLLQQRESLSLATTSATTSSSTSSATRAGAAASPGAGAGRHSSRRTAGTDSEHSHRARTDLDCVHLAVAGTTTPTHQHTNTRAS